MFALAKTREIHGSVSNRDAHENTVLDSVLSSRTGG